MAISTDKGFSCFSCFAGGTRYLWLTTYATWNAFSNERCFPLTTSTAGLLAFLPGTDWECPKDLIPNLRANTYVLEYWTVRSRERKDSGSPLWRHMENNAPDGEPDSFTNKHRFWKRSSPRKPIFEMNQTNKELFPWHRWHHRCIWLYHRIFDLLPAPVELVLASELSSSFDLVLVRRSCIRSHIYMIWLHTGMECFALWWLVL